MKKEQPVDDGKYGDFRIEGRVQREQAEYESGEMKLAAYVFDKAGTLLGNVELDKEGSYSVAVKLARPSDVELMVGPPGDAGQIRQSSAYSQRVGRG